MSSSGPSFDMQSPQPALCAFGGDVLCECFFSFLFSISDQAHSSVWRQLADRMSRLNPSATIPIVNGSYVSYHGSHELIYDS